MWRCPTCDLINGEDHHWCPTCGPGQTMPTVRHPVGSEPVECAACAEPIQPGQIYALERGRPSHIGHRTVVVRLPAERRRVSTW